MKIEPKAMSLDRLAQVKARLQSPDAPHGSEALDLLGHVLLLEKLVPAALLAGTSDRDGWHLTACRMERRNMPGACIEECVAARDTLKSLNKLPQ